MKYKNKKIKIILKNGQMFYMPLICYFKYIKIFNKFNKKKN